MSKFSPGRLLRLAENTLMVLAATMLMVMLFSMVIDASGRYLFDTPLAGNYEFTTYFGMVMLTYLALPKTYVIGGHVRLEILQPLLARIPYDLSARLNALLAALCFGAITLYAGAEAIEKFHARETTIGIIQIPIYISFMAFPVGCGILTIRLIAEIFFPVHREHNIEDEL
tara:strand:- start:32157 stop:32669 length:513 start_codon:yes stop_codon:yes gene_type:complete